MMSNNMDKISNLKTTINFTDIEFTDIGINKVLKKELIPKKVMFNGNATIVFWEDGTKTIVKTSDNETFDREKGFLNAFFQKYSLLTKTKCNKFLKSLDEIERNGIE